MYSKNKIFTIIFSFLLFTNISNFAKNDEILIDKISAVVNDTIISFSDIEKAILLFPILRKKDESEKAFYNQILVELINYRVIYLEYGNDIILNENDYEKVELQIIKKTGSFQKLTTILKRFDMTWEDFRVFIRERVFFEKTIKEKFQFKISISFNKVRKFYDDEYVPGLKRLNIIPKTLIEMTPQIENHLRRIETQKKINTWLKDIRDNYDIRILYK
jgi:hypothetical protein